MGKVTPKHITLLELSERWGFSLNQITSEVLNEKIVAWSWARPSISAASEEQNYILVPLPITKIQESYDLTPNIRIEDRKIGFHPIDKIETSDLPFEVAIENGSGVKLRETKLSDLLVKVEDITKIEENTSDNKTLEENDELTIDPQGGFILYQGQKFNFTSNQIQFLLILAKRKKLFLSGQVQSASLNGKEALNSLKKDSEVTSKKVSDLFQKKYESSLKSVTVDDSNRPKGIYQLRGTSIRIL